MTARGVREVLVALADPVRGDLLDRLVARGTATATELARGSTVSRQAIVKHLGVLHRSGLVTSQRVGREVRYAPRSAALEATASWMVELAAEWDRRLDAIKRLAEQPPSSE